MGWGRKPLLVLICLIGLLSFASAGAETRITYGQRLVTSTAVYGDLITWYETSGNGIHIYDLNTGKEINFPYKCYETHAESNLPIYRDRVTCSDGVNVTLYNISTGNITTIPNALHPDIYGDNVVYIRYGVNWTSLYLYNSSTKNEIQIINLTLPIFNPAISGNEVVWSTTTGILLYDIPTQRISLVSTSGASYPDIYGDVITWAKKGNIYALDVSTGRTKQITTSGTAGDPAIYGDKIVYECAGDIYLYNTSTGKTTQITTDGCAWSPSVYENKVVYVNSKEVRSKNIEKGDVYLTVITGSL